MNNNRRLSCERVDLLQATHAIGREEIQKMEMVRNAISWFEIPVDNLERERAFYSTIFDYDMPTGEIGQAKMGFLLYDESGGGVGGAVTKEEGTKPAGADGIRIYLNGGKNLNTVLNRVAGAGGSVVLP